MIWKRLRVDYLRAEICFAHQAQWEYACRAGTTTVYSWGNDINSTRANYNWDGGQQTVTILNKHLMWVSMANPWGFFDMHGNVWEWVTLEGTITGPQIDPEGPASGSKRVYRGARTDDVHLCVLQSVPIISPQAPVHTTLASVSLSMPCQPIRRIPNWNCWGSRHQLRGGSSLGEAWRRGPRAHRKY